MAETLFVSDRGQITLPLKLRKRYSLDRNTPLVIEETREGLLLRKADVVPLTTYSETEVKDWLKEDRLLPRDKKWFKK